MASYSKEENRNVVPNWRSYVDTIRLGELDSASTVRCRLPIFPLDSYIKSWNDNQNPTSASNLVCAGLSNGQSDNEEVLRAARFIISNEKDFMPGPVMIAKELFQKRENVFVNSESPKESLQDKINNLVGRKDFAKQQIRILREQINSFCYNPILYCELARCYTTLGLIEKAKRSIETALHLAPGHRFITRSASRFFLHIDDKERAKYILSHNPITKYDPWLLASEIAISSMYGRSSSLIKVGKEMINSKKYSDFSLSELSSAIGTFEALYGKRKECRKLMGQSLVNPNDNSVSQAEWLSSEFQDIGILVSGGYNLKNNFEPNARHYFSEGKFNEAILYSLDWCLDMPFTRRPIVLSSCLAYNYLKDYDSAISIIKYGLETHPDDYNMLNNLAYTYAMNNQVLEAKNVLASIPSNAYFNMKHEIVACLFATYGLVSYRSGDAEQGELFYQKATEVIKKFQLGSAFENKAELNNLREKVRISDGYDESLMSRIDKIDDFDIDELKQLKKDIYDVAKGKRNA